jgi:hypothetical protein
MATPAVVGVARPGEGWHGTYVNYGGELYVDAPTAPGPCSTSTAGAALRRGSRHR